MESVGGIKINRKNINVHVYEIILYREVCLIDFTVKVSDVHNHHNTK